MEEYFEKVEESFIYQNDGDLNITIQCKSNEMIEDIIYKYISKSLMEKGKYYFKYNGTLIRDNITFWEVANENDRINKSIIINVEDKKSYQNNESSKDISELNSGGKNDDCNILNEGIEFAKNSYFENINNNNSIKNENDNDKFLSLELK